MGFIVKIWETLGKPPALPKCQGLIFGNLASMICVGAAEATHLVAMLCVATRWESWIVVGRMNLNKKARPPAGLRLI